MMGTMIVYDWVTITPHTYRTLAHHRDMADRIMATLGYDKDMVCEIRVSEQGRTEVDYLWRHNGELQYGDMRTTIIEARYPSVTDHHQGRGVG